MHDWHAQTGTQFVSEESGLIEPALPAAPPVHRHRHDHVESAFPRDGVAEQRSQWLSQYRDSLVLENLDQLPQGSVVSSICESAIESAQSGTAKSAVTFGIQRVRGHEGRAAGCALILGGQWFGLREATAANGNSGKLIERRFADAAGIGEDERNQGSGESLSGTDKRCRER